MEKSNHHHILGKMPPALTDANPTPESFGACLPLSMQYWGFLLSLPPVPRELEIIHPVFRSHGGNPICVPLVVGFF